MQLIFATNNSGRLRMLSYHNTPIDEFRDELTDRLGIRILVKREDLNHDFVTGNKWWKLKYNLEEAKQSGFKRILTFGGAFSNHVYATAAAAREFGFESIGIIRGERSSLLNSTLAFAESCGMHLHFVTREQYRAKSEDEMEKTLRNQFGDFYSIPEGGTNLLAVKGCSEFAMNELSKVQFDHLFLPVGTGGTMAGLVCGFNGQKNITGISVLKNGGFLVDEIKSLTKKFSGSEYGNWQVHTSYDQGGYAKANETLKRFIGTMWKRHNLPFDHVYTAKMMWAIIKEAEAGNFKPGTTILALHTGGLQGSRDLLL
jgi:1-aminocyclopropane-1-carboxylate deaminase